MISALLDFLLCLSAFWLCLSYRKTVFAISIAGGILGIAALFGSLRFSNIWVNIPLHQVFSQLSAFISFPLLANFVMNPQSFINQHKTFAVTTAFILGVIGLVLVAISPLEISTAALFSKPVSVDMGAIWGTILPLASVAGLIYGSWRLGNLLLIISSLLFLVTFLHSGLAPILGLTQVGPLVNMDLLHIGLSLSVITFGLGARRLHTTHSQ